MWRLDGGNQKLQTLKGAAGGGDRPLDVLAAVLGKAVSDCFAEAVYLRFIFPQGNTENGI